MPLDDRLRAYAAEQGLSLSAARTRLITIALDHLEARRRGAAAARKGSTSAERSAAARKAVQARWAKRR